ncbi:Hypothetical_protein [Hexamita inflata]|uniref:Hypothetical_protein n=1 Tax=Hexamita inflata TaxID=28002 RepID=A0AA86NY90_9EUKA|nr:Hypothetical protein HINF_LOCUS14947 [Hexamita inflata]
MRQQVCDVSKLILLRQKNVISSNLTNSITNSDLQRSKNSNQMQNDEPSELISLMEDKYMSCVQSEQNHQQFDNSQDIQENSDTKPDFIATNLEVDAQSETSDSSTSDSSSDDRKVSSETLSSVMESAKINTQKLFDKITTNGLDALYDPSVMRNLISQFK